jgi:hypothetical protein
VGVGGEGGSDGRVMGVGGQEGERVGGWVGGIGTGVSGSDKSLGAMC